MNWHLSSDYLNMAGSKPILGPSCLGLPPHYSIQSDASDHSIQPCSVVFNPISNTDSCAMCMHVNPKQFMYLSCPLPSTFSPQFCEKSIPKSMSWSTSLLLILKSALKEIKINVLLYFHIYSSCVFP